MELKFAINIYRKPNLRVLMAQPTSPQRFSPDAPDSRARHCAAPGGEPHKLIIHFDLSPPLLQDPMESLRCVALLPMPSNERRDPSPLNKSVKCTQPACECAHVHKTKPCCQEDFNDIIIKYVRGDRRRQWKNCNYHYWSIRWSESNQMTLGQLFYLFFLIIIILWCNKVQTAVHVKKKKKRRSEAMQYYTEQIRLRKVLQRLPVTAEGLLLILWTAVISNCGPSCLSYYFYNVLINCKNCDVTKRKTASNGHQGETAKPTPARGKYGKTTSIKLLARMTVKIKWNELLEYKYFHII